MNGVNKVILIGNLGKDPELRFTPGGAAVANFSLATTEKWTDKGGQKQEKVEWHNIVAWNKTAELAQQYLKKGNPVYIEGKLSTRSWDDKDGKKMYKTEIVVTQMNFLLTGEKKPAHSEPANEEQQDQAQYNHATADEDLAF